MAAARGSSQSDDSSATGPGHDHQSRSRTRTNASDRLRLLLATAGALLLAATFGASTALALAPGRAYELVSPVYKGGYAANAILATSPDGETVAYGSLGAFAGEPRSSGEAVNDYIARRQPDGWSTAPLAPPASIEPSGRGVLDFSPDLGVALSQAETGTSAGQAFQFGEEQQFLTRPTDSPDTAENWTPFGTVLRQPLQASEGHLKPIAYQTASPSFSRVLFTTDYPFSAEVASPERQAQRLEELYELGPPGEDPSGPKLVGVGNDIGPEGEPEPIDVNCTSVLGSPLPGPESKFNALAASGEAVFFTANANRAAGAHCDSTSSATVPSNPAIVYARLGGERTVRISPPGPTAQFDGASESGQVVFFTMAEVLYRATLGCAEGGDSCPPVQWEVISVTPVSQTMHAAEPAGVQGVIALEPDATHAYFVAQGVMDETPGPEGARPIAGADNLYLFERDARYPAGRIAFVSDLCSGPGRSGEAVDSRCPLSATEPADAPLWSHASVPVQVNGCPERSDGCEAGRFLVFASFGRLSADDTNAAADVYRYDALTARLVRVSVGEDGYGANGNAGTADATFGGHGTNASLFEQSAAGSRAISEDGSRVVFTSARRLSENAAVGLVNAYEWHAEAGAGAGELTLVSSGAAAVENVVISPSGRDVFFTTDQGLVPQDADGLLDIYDARQGGGFASPAGKPPECVGEACQGPLTNPPPLLVAGSASQAPGENVNALPTAVVKAVPKPKLKACRKGTIRKKRRCVRKRRRSKVGRNVRTGR